MKLGTENRKKTIAAVVLAVVALLLLVRMLGTPSPGAAAVRTTASSHTPPAAAKRPAARNSPRDSRTKALAAVIQPTLDPRLQLQFLKASENIKYEGSGHNIFAERLEEIPNPVASACKDDKACGGASKAVPSGPPPGPPPPPPINLKFYGWASQAGEPKKIFLSQGDGVFVAGEGDIVNRRYKIVRIGPSSVEIEDLLSNNRQSIPLTQS
jgi:hypothetical protein